MTRFYKITYEAKERTRVSGDEQAIKLLEKLSEDDMKTSDERGVYYVLLGTCYRKTNNFEKAENLLQMALREKLKHETFIHPMCFVELAEIEIAQKNHESAKKYISFIKNYKDYDFQTELSQRVARLVDQMNGVDFKMV